MAFLKNLFHALRRSPAPSQTDRTKNPTSGDSRERPAFDWNDVEPPPARVIESFLSETSSETRQFPLAVALQVHDQIEASFTGRGDGELNALMMAEHRGGLRALKTFAKIYVAAIKPRRQDATEEDE